jgi:WhiB family transcriptional regulator, redox-sensing transcriptional regulator
MAVSITWLSRAACIGEDPELFFPERGEYLKSAAAKAVCARCPVTQECLAGAPSEFGIRGGLTPTERRPSRRGVA